MIKEKESIFFLKQTAALLKAGVPLMRTLHLIKEQSPQNQKADIEKIVRSIEAGESFSEALFKNGHFRSFIPSFRIAERDGMIAEALLRAADQAERKKSFKDNIKKTMTYPMIVVGLSMLCLVFLAFVVLPNFARIFSDMNCPLPLTTRILMSLPNYWMILFAFIFLAAVFIFKILNDNDRRFRIPILGKIFLQLSFGELCYNLGSQLKAGVPVVEALRSMSEGSKSRKIGSALFKIIKEVQGGSALSESFKNRGIFPDFLVQMLAIGEESGSLAQMLLSAGEIFESDGEQALKRLTLYVEPAATLTVGLAVGFVALAVMMPLFSMMGTLL